MSKAKGWEKVFSVGEIKGKMGRLARDKDVISYRMTGMGREPLGSNGSNPTNRPLALWWALWAKSIT